MKHFSVLILQIITALILVLSIAPQEAIFAQNVSPAAKSADFSSVAIMGDSLSQSYHDGVLHADAQTQNYLTILSKQIGFELKQGIIGEPGGYGARFSLKDPSKPIMPVSGASFLNLTLPPIPQSSIRFDPTVRVNNFAIGGAQVTDLINARPDPSKPNQAIFASLGVPWLSDNPPVVRSQIEFVEAMNPKPKTVILFIGGNDALGAAFSSDLSLLTSPDQFLKDYDSLVQRSKATGAQVIMTTVPNVTSTAAFVSAKDVMSIFAIPNFTQVTGIQPNDFVTLRAFGSLIDILFGRSTGPVPENQILRQSMAKTINKAVKKYNKGILKIAKREGFLVIDLNKFLDQAASPQGLKVGNFKLTTKYFGGVASFDGIHLTLTANALLANIFITEINKFYGTKYAMVDAAAVAATDIQVPKATSIANERVATEAEWLEAKPQFEAMSEAIMDLVNTRK